MEIESLKFKVDTAMPEKDKIKLLPETVKQKRQAELEPMASAIRDVVDLAQLIAQGRRTLYLEAVKQGFSEGQALELCKSFSL